LKEIVGLREVVFKVCSYRMRCVAFSCGGPLRRRKRRNISQRNITHEWTNDLKLHA